MSQLRGLIAMDGSMNKVHAARARPAWTLLRIKHMPNASLSLQFQILDVHTSEPVSQSNLTVSLNTTYLSQLSTGNRMVEILGILECLHS